MELRDEILTREINLGIIDIYSLKSWVWMNGPEMNI